MIRFLVDYGGQMTNEVRFAPDRETDQFDTEAEEHLIKHGKAERCVAPAPKLKPAPKKTRQRRAKQVKE